MGLQVNKLIYDNLNSQKKKKVINFLKQYLDKKVVYQIREAISHDPESWFSPYHLSWGMHIRNLLRKNGYGEDFFGIENLDDVYVELIEDTVKEN